LSIKLLFAYGESRSDEVLLAHVSALRINAQSASQRRIRLHTALILVQGFRFAASSRALPSELLADNVGMLEDEPQMLQVSLGDGDGVDAALLWQLPARSLDGLWESLTFDEGVSVKQTLQSFALSSLHFSQRRVSEASISWNRLLLLHGPPGTGKTTLCRVCAVCTVRVLASVTPAVVSVRQALAQKLSVRLQSEYAVTHLLEVNAHSLFSKWFSESGKLVTKLFERIHELARNPAVREWDVACVDSLTPVPPSLCL
jgi:hypothetical protein